MKVKVKVKAVPAPLFTCAGCIAEYDRKLCYRLTDNKPCGPNIYVIKEKKGG